MAVSFFLSVTPGLENLALDELRVKWGLLKTLSPDLFSEDNKAEVTTGGVLFQAPEPVGWILNHYLKIPTRILQRLDQFRVRDFPSLFKRISKLQWQEFLRQGDIEVKVSAHASRVKMKDRIRETVSEAIDAARVARPFRKAFLEVPQTVFVRLWEDQAIVSLDVSGQALYLRGYKTQTVDAPLRESLASALYWACRQHLGNDPDIVVDPMCGSGTLSFEALGFWQLNRMRKFAYENFTRAAEVTPFHFKKELVKSSMRAFGYDLNPQAIEAANFNGSQFSKKFSGSLNFSVDSIASTKKPNASGTIMVLINPPYNERLKADQLDLESEIIGLFERLKPDVAGVIWPGEKLPHRLSQSSVANIQTIHGGIHITMGILKP